MRRTELSGSGDPNKKNLNFVRHKFFSIRSGGRQKRER
jgi:hypothetical protein